MPKIHIIPLLLGLSLSGHAEEKSFRDQMVEAGKKTSDGLGRGVQKVRGLICGDGKKHCRNPSDDEVAPKPDPSAEKPRAE